MKLPTSYSPDGLTGAPASTHNPQIVRDTMLDAWRSRDLTHFAMFETRKDVDLPNHVSMRLNPADSSPRNLHAVAGQAAHELPVATQFRQELRADASPAIEVIGVLRDEELELAEPLELP